MSLPFPRNHNFCGREKELLAIHEQLQGTKSDISNQRIMVVCGLGGIGKTQLAAQYAYNNEGAYTSVWWVNASTTTSLNQGFLSIAQRLVSYHAELRIRTGLYLDWNSLGTAY